jgi:hypothetical protein
LDDCQCGFIKKLKKKKKNPVVRSGKRLEEHGTG